MTPEFAREFAEHGHDALWRICSGMYKIMIKDIEGNPTGVAEFRPNRTQRRFLKRLHNRNIILKARQLGFTTLICLLWLDFSLFNKNVRCGIVAQDAPSAQAFFRDKVKFAYENLDPYFKERFPLLGNSADELHFAHNNSSIRVATSFASATLHRLLISEHAKICAKYPEKANEITIGTLPTVPTNGIVVIESTGEGSEGDFYNRVQTAMKIQQEGRELTVKDYRLHFYPWWIAPEYRMSPENIPFTEDNLAYFDSIETEMNCELDAEQRAWYAATLRNEFRDDQIKMFSQYPSTPNEPFFVSNEGNYFRKEMAALRREGRLCRIPIVDVPVNTFWDLGNSDGCAIWFHQKVGMEHRFIGYFEAHGERLGVYVKELQNRGFVYNKHFLPHDASHKRLSDKNQSLAEMLNDLGLQNIEIVPKITDLATGIQITRANFPKVYIDPVTCELGVNRLDNYKKRWNTRDKRWSDEPDKSNGCSEAADAFRQWAQAENAGNVTIGVKTPLIRRRFTPRTLSIYGR